MIDGTRREVQIMLHLQGHPNIVKIKARSARCASTVDEGLTLPSPARLLWPSNHSCCRVALPAALFWHGGWFDALPHVLSRSEYSSPLTRGCMRPESIFTS